MKKLFKEVFRVEFFIGVIIYGVVCYFIGLGLQRQPNNLYLVGFCCVLVWLLLDIIKPFVNHKTDSNE
jgi:hypothetical protein